MDLLKYLTEYVELQAGLISEFQSKFRKSGNLDEWSILRRGVQKGVIGFRDQDWSFKRHGAGVSFENQTDGTWVDPHVLMGSRPRGFDSWRVFLFLESKNIKAVNLESQKLVFNWGSSSASMKLLNEAFKKLENAGKLMECADTDKGIFEIAETDQ